MATRCSSSLRLPKAHDQRGLVDLCYRLDLDAAALLAEVGARWQRVGPMGPMSAIAVSFRRDDAGASALDPVRYGQRETLDVHCAVFMAAGDRIMTGIMDGSPGIGGTAGIPDGDAVLATSAALGGVPSTARREGIPDHVTWEWLCRLMDEAARHIAHTAQVVDPHAP